MTIRPIDAWARDKDNDWNLTIQSRGTKWQLPIYELWIGDSDNFHIVCCQRSKTAYNLRKWVAETTYRGCSEKVIINRKTGEVVYQVSDKKVIIDKTPKKNPGYF
jgi:hypothetical protein